MFLAHCSQAGGLQWITGVGSVKQMSGLTVSATRGPLPFGTRLRLRCGVCWNGAAQVRIGHVPSRSADGQRRLVRSHMRCGQPERPDQRRGIRRTECTSTTRSCWSVPAAFRSNDISAVSQMYPDRVDLFGWDNIYSLATVGFVVGSAIPNLFYDFDSVQSAQWGYRVFHAHDSSSVDLRCRWLGSLQVYDCPGGYIPW